MSVHLVILYTISRNMIISIKLFIGKTDVIFDNLVCTQINDVCERSPCGRP